MSELMYHPASGITVWIFGKDGCPHCTSAVDLCVTKGVQHKYLNLSKGEWSVYELSVMIGYRPKTVPQIFIDEIHIGGFDDLKYLI